MTHYEMAEKLSEKLGVSLERATEALEACDWELLDAALLLEKEVGAEDPQAWSSRKKVEVDDPADDSHARRRSRGVVRGLGSLLRDLVNLGNRNRFEVRKDDELMLEVPVTVLVLLLVFAFWVCLPLLVVGLFFGFRYSFSGAELGTEGVNHAMDKAAEVAEKVKEEVSGDR